LIAENSSIEVAHDGPLSEIDDNESEICLTIRDFNDLGVVKDTQEFMKSCRSESMTRDSDDVCQVAIRVVKKLLGQDESNMFSREVLTIISSVRDMLDEKNDQNGVQENHGGSFGLHSQMPIIGGLEQKPVSKVSLMDLKAKILEKFNDKCSELEQIEEVDDENAVSKLLEKIKAYASVVEEINLKEKLIYKRAMSLILILLKQCRANVHDSNMIDICQTIIMPLLQKTQDRENQLMAVESIGLISLLEPFLFDNYSQIFETILANFSRSGSFDESDHGDISLKLAIIALKCSFDGLIFYGANGKTENLRQLIFTQYLFSPIKKLRQITIEGMCKMLFSQKFNTSLLAPS
jgi:hypothetical protein